MQVYQPFELFLGAAMFLLGVLGLGKDLYRALTHRFSSAYSDWRSLCLSVWFTTDGPAHFSRGFDPPHHESHRTSVLIAIALPFIVAVLLTNGIALVVDRKRKKAKHSETIAEQPTV